MEPAADDAPEGSTAVTDEAVGNGHDEVVETSDTTTTTIPALEATIPASDNAASEPVTDDKQDKQPAKMATKPSPTSKVGAPASKVSSTLKKVRRSAKICLQLLI